MAGFFWATPSVLSLGAEGGWRYVVLHRNHGVLLFPSLSPTAQSLRFLHQHLTERQSKSLRKRGYFSVGSWHMRYRIYYGVGENVFARGYGFIPLGGLNFWAQDGSYHELPIGDVMLAQKLALEHTPEKVRCLACGLFYDRAFRMAVRSYDQVYHSQHLRDVPSFVNPLEGEL